MSETSTSDFDLDSVGLEAEVVPDFDGAFEAAGEETRPSLLSRVVSRVKGWGLSLWHLVWPMTKERAYVLGGVLLAVSLGTGVWVLLQPAPPVPVEVPEKQAKAEAPARKLLSPQEHRDLGLSAMQSGDSILAQEQFSAGLELAGRSGQIVADLYRGLADLSEISGQPEAARLYRNAAAEALSGLDESALQIFELSEADLRAGNVREASKKFHLIALVSGEHGEQAKSIVGEVERRLARSFQAEYLGQRDSKKALDALPEPSLFERKVSQ